MSESKEDATARYMKAAHAMQTGVAMMIELRPKDVQPKSLRVGVNGAMVQHGALVALLIEKGVFTEEEYLSKLADAMEAEVKTYEREVSMRTGANIHLG